MNSSQRNRYQKIFHEPIYLLDSEELRDKTSFQVSGSTANIYKVVINYANRNITCSCPDMLVHCRTAHNVCKHSCFVLCKVLRLFNEESEFFKRLYFNDDEVSIINDAVNKISLTNSDYVNDEFIEMFNDMKTADSSENDGKEVKKVNKEDIYKQKKDTTEEDMCAICFDGFPDKDNVECPCCHNVLHKQCIEKWLSMGKENCVYCRSSIWKSYKKEHKTTTSTSSIKYKNLRT